MPKLFSIGGFVAAAVLIVLGLALIVVGAVGRTYVQDQLAKEAIVGSDDMTPDTTEAAIQEAGLENVSAPSCTVAGEEVDTGKEAKCFADYMRIHTLEATGGKTYAQMPRFATEDGAGTNEADRGAEEPGRLADEQPGSRYLGDRDRAHDRALHVLLRRGRLAVRDHRRRRDAAHRYRLRRVPDVRPQEGARRGSGGGNAAERGRNLSTTAEATTGKAAPASA